MSYSDLPHEMVMHKAAIARFSRTLATMFAAGVPLVEAMESVAGATGNIVYEDATHGMRDEVATGQRLQRADNRRQTMGPAAEPLDVAGGPIPQGHAEAPRI